MDTDQLASLFAMVVSLLLGALFGWIQYRLFRTFMISSVLEAVVITTLMMLAFGACLFGASVGAGWLGVQSDWVVLAPLVVGFLAGDRWMRVSERGRRRRPRIVRRP